VISLDQSEYTVSETDGSLEVCASVTVGQLTQSLQILFTTSDGTAGRFIV